MSANTRGTQESIVGEADPKTIKRAQYEAFEFELEALGLVRVINGSHENPEDHSYLVNVETVTLACECKSFQYNEGLCKHCVAVAICQPVLQAAQSVPIPDGEERSWRPARTTRKVAAAHRETTCRASSVSNPRRGK